MREDELEHQRASKLDNGKQKRGNVLVLHAEADDGDADDHAYGKACIVDDARLKVEVSPRCAQVHNHECDRRNGNSRRAHANDDIARLSGPYNH